MSAVRGQHLCRYLLVWGLSLTEWVATAQLRLLGILPLQLVTDAVEQLHVALLWVLLHCRDESPRHGAGSLSSDLCVLPVKEERQHGTLTLASQSESRSRRKRANLQSNQRNSSCHLLGRATKGALQDGDTGKKAGSYSSRKRQRGRAIHAQAQVPTPPAPTL